VPSTREHNTTVDVVLYDVIAMDGAAPSFIRHTGLASKPGENERDKVEVVDMFPPLRLSGAMTANAIGRPELEEGEWRKIKIFLDLHAGEHSSILHLTRTNLTQVYCILPHAAPYDEKDRRYARTRFSCAGLVVEAYKRAGINLVEENRLPLINLDQIKRAYPDCAGLLEITVFREAMGLTGTGPWPVLLCGYLINSLSRSKETIRNQVFVATAGDEYFPRPTPAAIIDS
jgi:hypothetical protein